MESDRTEPIDPLDVKRGTPWSEGFEKALSEARAVTGEAIEFVSGSLLVFDADGNVKRRYAKELAKRDAYHVLLGMTAGAKGGE